MCAFAFVKGDVLQYADEGQYLEIARNLTSGAGYALEGEPTAFRPPTWPLILSAGTAFGLPVSALRVISALLLVAGAAVAALLGRRLAGSAFGLLAGLAVLLYPLNVYTAATLYPQALATVLILALWWIASTHEDREQRPIPFRTGLLTGLLIAALALAVPTLIVTGALILVWILYRQRGNRLRFATSSVVGFLLPVGVWTVRNFAVFGSAIPFSTSSGINLLLGNSANATPVSGINADISGYTDEAARRGLDEFDRDTFFRHSAVEWIHGNPGEAIALYAGKTLNYFSGYNQPATSGSGGFAEALVAWSSLIVIAALVVVRIALSARVRMLATEKFFLVLFVVNAPVMAVFFTRTRFRQPLDVILLVEAAVAVAILSVGLVDRMRTKNRQIESQTSVD